jgi:uroporphyrin-III C-methyltransferase
MPLDQTGRVTLAGAGPGDPDLLTLRALRAIESAEALLFDSLVSPEIIALAPERCVKLGVGKRGDRTSVPQHKTNALLLRLARRGLRVVRLKGGDPSVFGRVEEERAYLEAHGIPVETIPGVTAASAAAAQLGFPLTHRGEARRLVYLTARTRADGSIALDTPALADREATLVFYMSSHVASEIEVALLKAGWGAEAPALIVEKAGTASVRARRTVVCRLARDVRALAPQGPTLIVVGSVCARLDQSCSRLPLVLLRPGPLLCDVQQDRAAPHEPQLGVAPTSRSKLE